MVSVRAKFRIKSCISGGVFGFFFCFDIILNCDIEGVFLLYILLVFYESGWIENFRLDLYVIKYVYLGWVGWGEGGRGGRER